MNLLLDKNSFWSILQIANNATGIRTDVLEKDYYVTLFLKELADKQDTPPAYFKGGTALYKALHSIRRFSEDIDLTVCIDSCTNSQAKKRLDRAANGYLSLPRTVQKSMESNNKGSITSVYDY
jgi:predicted nucleotidyltransferase component of viral defense system